MENTFQMLTRCSWVETIAQNKSGIAVFLSLIWGLQQLQCNGLWKLGKASSHFVEVNLGAKLTRTIELHDLVFDRSHKLCSFFILIFRVLSRSWSPQSLSDVAWNSLSRGPSHHYPSCPYPNWNLCLSIAQFDPARVQVWSYNTWWYLQYLESCILQKLCLTFAGMQQNSKCTTIHRASCPSSCCSSCGSASTSISWSCSSSGGFCARSVAWASQNSLRAEMAEMGQCLFNLHSCSEILEEPTQPTLITACVGSFCASSSPISAASTTLWRHSKAFSTGSSESLRATAPSRISAKNVPKALSSLILSEICLLSLTVAMATSWVWLNCLPFVFRAVIFPFSCCNTCCVFLIEICPGVSWDVSPTSTCMSLSSCRTSPLLKGIQPTASALEGTKCRGPSVSGENAAARHRANLAWSSKQVMRRMTSTGRHRALITKKHSLSAKIDEDKFDKFMFLACLPPPQQW